MANLGFFALLCALGCALYAVAASVAAARGQQAALLQSARNAALLTWPLLTLACGLLIFLLLTIPMARLVDWLVRREQRRGRGGAVAASARPAPGGSS